MVALNFAETAGEWGGRSEINISFEFIALL